MEILNRDQALVVNLFVCATLALVVLLLRLYTRLVVICQVGADDYLMVGAFMASIAFFIAEMFRKSVLLSEELLGADHSPEIKYGLGRSPNPDTLTPFLQVTLSQPQTQER